MAFGIPFKYMALLYLAGLPVFVLPFLFRMIGNSIRSRTQQRREILLSRSETEEKEQTAKTGQAPKKTSSTSLDEDWEEVDAGSATPPKTKVQQVDESYRGFIGFFHPFCNAGGGGERVLFAAIQATQRNYPNANCVVYTGDHDVTKEQILTNVRNRFNITLNPARISFLYLTTREWVLPSKWPRFTLLGQSLGSLLLGWDAFNLLVPDVFIDTMGYAFVLALCKWLFPSIPTGAYVHFPTISTDMLSSLHDETSSQGLNAGAGKGAKGQVKAFYWKLFAWLYSWVGGSVDVVMTNSSWTQRHISSLWGPKREKNRQQHPISVVYPPCAVEELRQNITVSETDEKQRTNNILYIAQFRPEKMHQEIISAFAIFLKASADLLASLPIRPRLILCGSVRDSIDEKLVYKLRLQAQEIKDGTVEFVINAKWPQILDLLRSSSIGANGMWNEHFGIGVVEYQAAGLISVVNDSGGPKEDIVIDVDGEPTGFLASNTQEFADGFAEALSLSQEDALAMRLRARKNSLRFSEEVFSRAWTEQLGHLIELGRKVS